MRVSPCQLSEGIQGTTIEIGKRGQSLRKRFEASEMETARDHFVDGNVAGLLLTKALFVWDIGSHHHMSLAAGFDDVAQQRLGFTRAFGLPACTFRIKTWYRVVDCWSEEHDRVGPGTPNRCVKFIFYGNNIRNN